MLKANKKLECLSEEMENLSKETEDIKIICRVFFSIEYKFFYQLCAYEYFFKSMTCLFIFFTVSLVRKYKILRTCDLSVFPFIVSDF